MAGPTRISELSDGSPVQPTDQVPVARGSGATGYTYKVNAGRFISDLFNVGNSSTVDLIWNTSTRTLSAQAKASSSVVIQDTPPSSSQPGDFWYDSSSGVLSLRYNDGDSTQWVDVGGGDAGPLINTQNTPTVNLGWNSTTNTLSADASYLLTLINTLSTNMQNIGNYPYLEYAWVTSPDTAGQTINANTIETLTLTTEVADTGNFGSIASNQITLAAGTYQFEANTHGSAAGITGGAGSLALYNISDSLYVSRGSSQSGASDNCDNPILKGQFTIAAQKTFVLRYYNANLTTYIKNTTNGNTSTISTANAEQRTTIKLWKVG